jgi:hypothetical protein
LALVCAGALAGPGWEAGRGAAGRAVGAAAGRPVVIHSYSGMNPPAGLIWPIEHGQAAGVIFFGQNIAGRTQIAGVIKGPVAS